MPLRVPMDWPWSASVLLVERQGTIIVGGLIVAPAHRSGDRLAEIPPSGLTVRELRSVRLSEAFRDSYALYVGFPEAVRRELKEGELIAIGLRREPAPRGLISTGRTKAPPRRGEHLTEDGYAQIAMLYLWALQKAPRQPLRWMVEHYRKGGHRASRDNLRDRVHTARERGFLTAGRPGSAGAQETAKLLEWKQQRKRKRRR